MARQPRQIVADYPYHVMQRGHDRRAVFHDSVDRTHYLQWLREAALECRLVVHAYVLMDNHVHLLVTPGQPRAISQVMQALGRRYVPWFNRRHGRSGTLWEGRFRASLVDADSYFLACQRYIEANPVRAGMVQTAADWPWSSHRHYRGWSFDPLVTPHSRIWALGNTPFEREAAYPGLLEQVPTEGTWEHLRKGLSSGRPWVTEQTMAQLSLQEQERWLRRPRGRPAKNASK